MPGQSSGRSKSPNAGPARKRYWLNRILEQKKVKNLLKNLQPKVKGDKPMTEAQAVRFWRKARLGRVPEGFIPRVLV